MPEPVLFPRLAERRLVEALEDSPVVLIHGPRQCGKTTLARMAAAGPDRLGYAYVSLDDAVARDSARHDPAGFVGEFPDRVILDEVQRAPELFEAIKLEVDRRRKPGRFLLTGSTNVLLLPTLSESLAGRLEIVRLHPLAQRETAPQPTAPVGDAPQPTAPAGDVPRREFLDALFGGGFEVRRTERLGAELPERIAAGGFAPAVLRPTHRRRANWHRSYVETLVARDVRDVANIRSLDVLPRLLSAVASQTARLFNLTDLAAPFQLSRPTIGDYVALLERLFLFERLLPWHSNRLSRLVKSPKLHFVDTGVATTLLGTSPAGLMADRRLLGQLLESFVYQELRRQAGWHDAPFEFFHFRDRDGYEVDVVIEQGPAAVAGVEVKASATVRTSDFRGLRKLAAATGDRFAGGVVLYDGEMTARFGDRLHAVPVRRLWEPA